METELTTAIDRDMAFCQALLKGLEYLTEKYADKPHLYSDLNFSVNKVKEKIMGFEKLVEVYFMEKKKKKKTQRPSLAQFQEEIRKRAEEIYHDRINEEEEGDEISDWLQAEMEVKKKYKL